MSNIEFASEETETDVSIFGYGRWFDRTLFGVIIVTILRVFLFSGNPDQAFWAAIALIMLVVAVVGCVVCDAIRKLRS